MKLTIENINKTFQPSAPIIEREDFVGRKNLLKLIDRAVNSVGAQIVIFGERGVGKTSFVNIGLGFSNLNEDYKIFEYNCSHSDSFYDIIGSFLRATDQLLSTSETKSSETQSVDGKLKAVVAEGGGKFDSYREETKKAVIPASFTLNDIVTNYLMGKYIIIIDEYDRIEKSQTKIMLAETLKIISNYHSDTKFIITGVANSAKILIGDHLSILRNLAVIPIPRMSNEEILEIIRNGSSKLKLKYSDELTRLILLASNGLPYFTHLICKQLSYVALDNNTVELDTKDFFEALEIILINLPEHIKTSYDLACSRNPAVFQIEQNINASYFDLITHPSTIRKEVLHIFALVDECNLEKAKRLFKYFIEIGSVFEPDKYKSMDEILFHSVLSEIARISDIVIDYDTHILFKDSYHKGYSLLQAANYLGKDTFMKLINFK